MSSGSIHVKVSGVLQEHIRQQIGEDGLFENASEYVRALIRNDLQNRNAAWDELKRELAPAMSAGDSQFVEVTAEDVIRRNKSRQEWLASVFSVALMRPRTGSIAKRPRDGAKSR